MIFLIFSFLFTDIKPSNMQKITDSQAIELVRANKVSAMYFYDGEARVLLVESVSKADKEKFPNDADYYFSYTNTSLTIILEAIDEYNRTEGVQKVVYETEPVTTSWLESLLPYLIMAGLGFLCIFFIFRMSSKSNAGAMQFGQSKARMSNNVKVRFSDIAGADEEKEELAEIVEFLKNPKKFTDLGARIPKGVLLVGNPGTGKTLLARAVAGESNVPFLSISGSDFVEMFVGVGASRVRDLFAQAKKSTPCIVFIDEIDAVGRQRGAGLGGGNDEREQTLNQLLVEMDGFDANEGIIVLAATNRSDVLDPALMRPGRFDRQIYVHTPDVVGREGIIKIHAKNKPLGEDVDYKTLARITSGFTGADLENMLNEAAILAARKSSPTISMEDITEGINKVIMGPQKKSLRITEKDKLITAYHESGHAVLGKLLEHCENVQEVSIIPRGQAAGYTMSRPDTDDNHMGKQKLNDTIAMTMGGRLAEELYMDDISTGASNDIKQATDLARKMVTDWGMSDKFGFMNFSSEQEIFVGRDYQSKNNYSEKTQSEIDAEIKSILDYNYSRARKILKDNSDIIKNMAELLLEKETIYTEEVDMLIAGKTKDEVALFMDEQEAKRKEKEKELKAKQELDKQIQEADQKVQTAMMYLKNGIITEKEYELIVADRNKRVAELEAKKAEEQNPEQPQVEENKPEVEEKPEVENKSEAEDKQPQVVEQAEQVQENEEKQVTDEAQEKPKKTRKKQDKGEN
ncbi:MAG: ATP-dependent zinc metalloprotease FtsH [Clostridia bacterium]|nr:ATP-dependent zinc metalloprotease FtsH [Clostridia bacterium]